MNAGPPAKRSPLKLFLLMFAFSVPLWVLSALIGTIPGAPMNLPWSALQFFFPLIAASILVFREGGIAEVGRLLKRAFDFTRVKRKVWYLPVVLLMPAVMVLSYWAMRLLGRPLPDETSIAFVDIPLLLLLFLFSGIFEEVGWMGYAVDPMRERWSALTTGVIMGSVWGAWHVIPWSQTHSPAWVAWQALSTIALRVLIVWLCANMGGSVFVAALFHTMSNICDSLFPNNGSHYDPAVTGTILVITAALVTALWGPKTLTRYAGHRSEAPDRSGGLRVIPGKGA